MSEKNLFDNLSDEIKEKLRDCKSEEELTKVLADAGIELDKEMLKAVDGGFAFDDILGTTYSCRRLVEPCRNTCRTKEKGRLSAFFNIPGQTKEALHRIALLAVLRQRHAITP